jgi:hypothetical protein
MVRHGKSPSGVSDVDEASSLGKRPRPINHLKLDGSSRKTTQSRRAVRAVSSNRQQKSRP